MPQHWQDFNGSGHSCHWWHHLGECKLTAMMFVALILVFILAIVGGLYAGADRRDPNVSLFREPRA
jgi:hypothetical protein